MKKILFVMIFVAMIGNISCNKERIEPGQHPSIDVDIPNSPLHDCPYLVGIPGTFLLDMAIDNNHVFYFITEEFGLISPPWSSYLPIKGYLSRKTDETGKFEILFKYFGAKMCFDKNNQLWLMNSNTVYKVDGSSFNRTKIFETSGMLQFIAVDNDNNIWTGGLQTGLYKIDDKMNVTQHTVNNPDLPTNSMTNIHIDKNNNIWVALWDSQGVLKISNGQWVVYNSLNSEITSQNIWCLVTDKNGHLWIGTGHDNENQSLMRFDGTQWETVIPRNDKNEIVTGTVRRIQSDGNKIYVVSEKVKNKAFYSNELLTFDGLKWDKIFEIPEDDGIDDLIVDDHLKVVWVRTLNKGIFKIPF